MLPPTACRLEGCHPKTFSLHHTRLGSTSSSVMNTPAPSESSPTQARCDTVPFLRRKKHTLSPQGPYNRQGVCHPGATQNQGKGPRRSPVAVLQAHGNGRPLVSWGIHSCLYMTHMWHAAACVPIRTFDVCLAPVHHLCCLITAVWRGKNSQIQALATRQSGLWGWAAPWSDLQLPSR